MYFNTAPAINAPIIAPTGGDAAKVAKVKFRALPGGTMIVRVATAFGIRMPPPTPVKARITMKETYVLQKALQSEKTTRMAPPNINSLWWPYTAPSRPLIKTKEPWVSLDNVISVGRVQIST